MDQRERDQLIGEYRESVRLVRRALRNAKERRDPDRSNRAAMDYQHLASMERDLLWTIEYLETGVMPDYHRGAYRCTVPVDPHVLKRCVKVVIPSRGSTWTTFNPELDKLLNLLSPREKEAFVMVRGRGISYRDAADYMDLKSSGAVSTLVRRAERKLRKELMKRSPEPAYSGL